MVASIHVSLPRWEQLRRQRLWLDQAELEKEQTAFSDAIARLEAEMREDLVARTRARVHISTISSYTCARPYFLSTTDTLLLLSDYGTLRVCRWPPCVAAADGAEVATRMLASTMLKQG